MNIETESLGIFAELGKKLHGMVSLSTLKVNTWKLLTRGYKIVVKFKGRKVKFREELRFLL